SGARGHRPRAVGPKAAVIEAAAIDAVLLIAFGGPTAPHEIRPFLEIVTRDRSVPAERLAEVARHYERMPGGRSPLGTLTLAQARGLERALAASGPALPVFVGMRNWHPFLHETLADMTAKGVKRALGIILSPLRTEASWERYRQDVTGPRAKVDGARDRERARARAPSSGRRERPPGLHRDARRAGAGRLVRLVVVGGGITGLAAAYRAVEVARERRIALELTLVEARDRLGGTIATE